MLRISNLQTLTWAPREFKKIHKIKNAHSSHDAKVPIFKKMRKEKFLPILEKAIQAPSADNLQPWKFKLLEEGLELSLEENAIQSFCDAGYLAPYISAGAAIENMRVAASASGLELEAGYLPEKKNPLYVARIEFRAAPLKPHPHLGALNQRLTNRKFYDRKKKMPLSIYDALNRAVASREGFELLWIKKDDPHYRHLAKILGDGDQLRFENRRLHKEFFHILRYNNRESERSKDGLSIGALDAGPFSGFLFPFLKSWKRMRFMNLLGMSLSMNFYTRLQMQSSQAAILLVAPGRMPENFIRGGEVMEHLWHEMTLHGLSAQPMEGLPIFIIDEQVTGGSSLSGKQRNLVKRLKDRFFSIFGIDNEKGLIMLFRIGYAPPPTARTLRRPVESFLV